MPAVIAMLGAGPTSSSCRTGRARTRRTHNADARRVKRGAGGGHYPVVKQLIAVLCLGACVDDPDLAETSFAVTSLVLEGEASTGGGVNETDTTASAGAVLVLPTVYTTAQQPFTTSGWTYSGSARVRGEACNPWVRIRIDGQDAVVQQITSAWTTINFWLSVPPGSHTLQLYHRNGGCAIRVDHVTLAVEDPQPPPDPPPPPVVVEAESAIGQGAVVTDSAASGGAYRAFAAADEKASTTFATTTATTGSVRVRSSGCFAEPVAKVTIDGAPTTTYIPTSGAWVTMSLPPLANGNHTIEFAHRYGRTGCALHFDHATFTP